MNDSFYEILFSTEYYDKIYQYIDKYGDQRDNIMHYIVLPDVTILKYASSKGIYLEQPYNGKSLIYKLGDTPIISAIRADKSDMVKLLIEFGADLEYVVRLNVCEFTNMCAIIGKPVHFAIQNNNIDMIKRLINAGIDLGWYRFRMVQ